MNAITLGYHDIIFPGAPGLSGFASSSGMHYKLPAEEFRAHLEGIAEARFDPPARVLDPWPESVRTVPFYLTFDDGGSSAMRTADELDRRGWQGHFFVTTDFIGTNGFLAPGEILELHQRGHLVGSHSCSHPMRMSTLAPERIAEEWRKSISVLSEILGARVSIASVPGGDFSTAVAQRAADAGVVALFTSEPVTGIHRVGGCRVYGRYAITRGVPSPVVVAIVLRKLAPRARQYTLWNLKKAVKAIAGDHYSTMQKKFFERPGRRNAGMSS